MKINNIKGKRHPLCRYIDFKDKIIIMMLFYKYKEEQVDWWNSYNQVNSNIINYQYNIIKVLMKINI